MIQAESGEHSSATAIYKGLTIGQVGGAGVGGFAQHQAAARRVLEERLERVLPQVRAERDRPRPEQIEGRASVRLSRGGDVAALGIEAEFVHVTQRADIFKYPILGTPGLVINEKVVSAGRIPTEAEISTFLADALEAA